MKKYKIQDGLHLVKLTEEEYHTVKELYRQHKNNVKQAAIRFRELYGCSITKVIAYGDPSNADNKLLSHIIPRHGFNGKAKYLDNGYKCFIIDDPSIIIHETRDSSWNCLIKFAGNPKYVLVIKD